MIIYTIRNRQRNHKKVWAVNYFDTRGYPYVDGARDFTDEIDAVEWWDNCRRELKQDVHFVGAVRFGELFEYWREFRRKYDQRDSVNWWAE